MEDPGKVGHQMSCFTHPVERVLINRISGSRKCHFIVEQISIKIFGLKRYHFSSVSCMKVKRHSKSEKWDRIGRSGASVGRSGTDEAVWVCCQQAQDSVVAGLEVQQQVQTGPGRMVSVRLV